jgi:hypothetical protein
LLYETTKELTSFRDVVNNLNESEETNWILLSTGGWHGTNQTLDDCERILKGDDEKWTEQGAYITVFIILPESVTIKWGEVRLKNLNEVEWLRRKVRKSLESISNSQEGNQ